jgi:short-subunit dehydrogenase
VALVARRADRLEALAGEIGEGGGHALALPGDVTEEPFVIDAVARVLDRWARLDVLVNNAGRGLAARFEDTTAADLRAILELNVVSVLTVTRAVLATMRAQGRGHIVNVSSVGIPLRSAYAASKFALGGLSEALRVELRVTGIHVTLVYPIFTTETEFHAVEPRRLAVPTRPGPVQPARHVARAIVRCMRRPRPEVYCCRPARVLALLSVLAPGAVDLVVGRGYPPTPVA